MEGGVDVVMVETIFDTANAKVSSASLVDISYIMYIHACDVVSQSIPVVYATTCMHVCSN